ncbi:MAG: hypothetical protein PHX08_01915 [Lachnospiraceae bacterium]|nr:hypothetical protein [Lachnospiraceae bacterium]
MNKSIQGYCPTQNKDYAVTVSYIPSSTLDGSTSYSKGIAECSYTKAGNACTEECPIVKSAPRSL